MIVEQVGTRTYRTAEGTIICLAHYHAEAELGDPLTHAGGILGGGFDVVDEVPHDTPLQPEERLMSEQANEGFVTLHFYNGIRVSSLPDTEIFRLVMEVDNTLSGLSKLDQDSTAVKAHIKKLTEDKTNLMAEVDSRHKAD